ncbi:DUF3291 domain-containing protein [Deinococcus hopiensis]|uniref:DUF3291 domain-containing protein n=1 Tax=Deinococcus hopiensis KR-140 TaxID=695939 RepID=A0A1W1UYM6_9DEIO|nr:DUF3291 domain-containing protein [Deinococcus hopiensis]SMB85834.1 protein of unknown function [Deinococcus hopiensis KR-140]
MHLAQVNVAKLHFPLDAPEIAEFKAGLDPVNSLADAAPGFVWRLKDDTGNATEVVFDADPLLIVNLSVWEGLGALHAFSYSGLHLDFLKRRREWFQRYASPHLALWWVPMGSQPTVQDAQERLAHLHTYGPTAHAFTFTQVFEADGSRTTLRRAEGHRTPRPSTPD